MTERLDPKFCEWVRNEMIGLSGAARMALLRKMGDDVCGRLLHEWPFWARPNQRWDPEGEEETTAWVTGRGYGKTRTGSETTHEVAEDYAEMIGGEMVLVGQTGTDMRDVMIEGKSGIMATSKPWFPPKYEPSKMKITWPNGVVAHLRSSERPKLIRGLSVGFAWGDECAHWFDAEEVWDMLDLALREGNPSKRIVTTTPLPTKFIRKLLADASTKVIRGSTHENIQHLDPTFIPKLEARFGRSQKGRQEVWGEVVKDNVNACFKQDHIRRIADADVPKIIHIGIGCDPSGGEASVSADESGIIGMGVCHDGNLYVFHDWSDDISSAKWGAKCIRLGVLMRGELKVETPVTIVGEKNFGGDMVASACKLQTNWKASGLRFELVTAVGSKATRADPIAQHAENGHYFHVGAGQRFRDLEVQMTQWDSTLPRRVQDSPDRMDAMVHIATFLLERWAKGAAQMKKLTAKQMAKVQAVLNR